MPSLQKTTPTLLLIDDSIEELRVLIDMLSARNWRMLVSFDGLDGYRKASLKQPDLILLDVRMPGMNGFDTCRRLKSDPRTRSIPLIFLTSADDKEDRLTGLSLGSVDYIIKPYVSEEEVLARISIHLDLARRLAEVERDNVSRDDKHTSLVASAAKILLDNLTNPPSPELLASRLGTNEKRLNKAFQEAFSLPVYGWLREQRWLLARQLLLQTDASITDISAHCGFASPANFATAFKDRFECTPRDFRKKVNQHHFIDERLP